jgi:hypothetical protein
MPRGVYLPIIHRILDLLRQRRLDKPCSLLPNVHVVVSENPTLDSQIREDGIDENAEYLPGFKTVDREVNEGMPRIWIPVLGEGQEEQLRKIRELVRPNQVCPLLPFPASDPRRGDNLIREYQKLLFDDLQVEPRDIIYSHEQNPFQVYRTLCQTSLRYDRAFRSFQGCKIFLSANSSKLLSLGVILAAYDLKLSDKPVGVAHVDSHGYELDNMAEQEDDVGGELFELWLVRGGHR